MGQFNTVKDETNIQVNFQFTFQSEDCLLLRA